MLIQVPAVLPPDAMARVRQLTVAAEWADGRITAGTQSEQSKNNLQIPEDSPAAIEAGKIVLDALQQSALFFTAALPKRIFPPLFNCYTGAANAFGNHVDNAVRTVRGSGVRVRTDLSATLFLSDPSSYDGGELVVHHTTGTRAFKLPAGHALLYPASTVHEVTPVTRGERLAAFFWVQSLVADESRRQILFDLDMNLLRLRARHGDSAETTALSGVYHNLLRQWSQL